MKCQSCSQEAKVHLTDISSDGQKKEVHLCPACAEKKKLISKQELNMPAILQTLIGAQIKAHVGARAEELARLTCPVCGIKYMEFRAEGRLGCAHDYEVFREELEPILRRIHHAHRDLRHLGKYPKNRARTARWQREALELRRQLQQAIDEEAYEQAAQIRDLIREKERLG